MPVSPNVVAVGPALLAAVLVAVVDWVAVARRWRGLELIAKPSVILALLAAVAASPGPVAPDHGPLAAAGTLSPGWLLVLGGLFASLLGDLLLVPPARFVAGLVAFLVAQVAYLVRFVGQPIALGDPAAIARIALGLAIALAVAWLPGRRILAGARRAGLGAPVAVYLVAILAMALAATASGLWISAVGAWLFVASDAMLGLARFADGARGSSDDGAADARWNVATMAAYHAGQVLIVVGLLA